jgi:hypothetical protein
MTNSGIEPKRLFFVSARLESKARFIELEVRSKFKTLEEAQARAQEFADGWNDWPKAKVETQIEVIELPHLANCFECKKDLFKGDLVYFIFEDVFCYACAEDKRLSLGYHDFLGDSAIGNAVAGTP